MTRRQRRVRRRAGNPKRKLGGATIVVGIVAGLGLLGVGGWVIGVAGDAPDVNAMRPVNQDLNSVVFAGDGSRLGLVDSDALRIPVSLNKVPKSLRNATVAIEDERFYQHDGIDVQGGMRALVRNLEAGGISEGASTITMQLMRNLYIANPDRSVERKIVEARMAIDYETEHSKPEILREYLNSAPYGTNDGRTAIGVQAASRIYFSRSVEKISLPQAALLAGLPQAPSAYNPVLNPSGAKERRDEVLDAMAEQGMISADRAAAAKAKGLQVDINDAVFDRSQPFFFDYVESELIKEYGVETVRQGGLEIHTTIEPALQEAGLASINSALPYSYDPAAALVAIDPRNGEVKAMVSSATYSETQYNLAAQGRRQPGSTFKTFTLAAAVNEGMNPDSTYYVSKPLDINDPEYGPWKVSTYSDSYSGTTSVARATLSSDNSVYAQLALDVGPDKVAEMARKMGVTSKLNGYPAESLGGLEIGVSPLEMASAYGTLAAGGVHRDPVAIKKVVFPDGKVDRPDRPKPERVMSEAAAYVVTEILHGNMTGGTGTGAYTGCVGQAGKTGTTDNFTDAWFAGYQPNLSTATWVGYPESNEISMTSVHGISVAGGTFPASIWGSFYSNAGIPCEDFPVPTETMVWGSFNGDFTVSSDTVTEFDGTDEEALEAEGADQDRPDREQDGGDDPSPGPAPRPPSGGGGGGGDSGGGGGGGVTPGGGITPG